MIAKFFCLQISYSLRLNFSQGAIFTFFIDIFRSFWLLEFASLIPYFFSGFFRGSEMNQQQRGMQKRDEMRFNSGEKIPPPPPPPQHQSQLGSNSMGRYDSGPGGGGGGYGGNGMGNNSSGNSGTRQGPGVNSSSQQPQQSNLRNRYDSEGSTGSGKAAADAMRGVQMNFKASITCVFVFLPIELCSYIFKHGIEFSEFYRRLEQSLYIGFGK